MSRQMLTRFSFPLMRRGQRGYWMSFRPNEVLCRSPKRERGSIWRPKWCGKHDQKEAQTSTPSPTQNHTKAPANDACGTETGADLWIFTPGEVKWLRGPLKRLTEINPDGLPMLDPNKTSNVLNAYNLELLGATKLIALILFPLIEKRE